MLGRLDAHDVLLVHAAPPVLTAEVRDDGPGVSPEQAGLLFRPYFTTKRSGTGLGLFVTRKLVEALAAGRAGAALTEEAKATLARMRPPD